MITIHHNSIYVQTFSPANLLEIDTSTGEAFNWPGSELKGGDWRDGYLINQRTPDGVPATQEEVIMALGQAICSLNERMKSGF